MTNSKLKRMRQRKRRRKIKHLKASVKSITFSLIMLFFLVSGIVFLSTLVSQTSSIQKSEVPEIHSQDDFIEFLSPYAIDLHQEYGVLPSIILAQAILESDWGQSGLSQPPNNNLFGVKAYGSQKKVHMKTKEFVNGEWIEIEADFRVYPDWQSSLKDHTMLFVRGVNWNPDLYKKVLEADNYKEAAKALQEAGYATDPGYTNKLIEVIESHDLDQYDVSQPREK